MIFMLRRNALTMAAVIALILILILALLAPAIVPYPQDIADKTNLSEKFQPPSSAHLFGTDELGRDVFSRVLYGTRISLSTAVLAVALSLIIGVPLGAVAGTFGGAVDEIIMRITDIFLSFPPMLLAILLVSMLGPSLNNAILAIALAWWPWYTRIVRGQAISLKERKFIQAAETIGTPKWKIVAKHIIPNTISPVVVQASMDMGGVILTIASLSYLGLGAQAPSPEWGLMISQGKQFLSSYWYMSIIPGVAIVILTYALNYMARIQFAGRWRARDP